MFPLLDVESDADAKRTLEDFWAVLEEDLDESQRRDLLRFATACSRPPMFGFRELHPPFSVQLVPRDLPDVSPDRLPTSSTCMHLLKLPIYADRAVLRRKLLYAISANAGFEFS